MATSTPNLGLRKPATTDFVTVTTDINENMDDIDPWFPPSPDNGFAEYARSANQTITTGTDTKVAFPDAISTTGLVTPNGSFNEFVVNRGGVWSLGFGFGRWSANPTENFLWLGPSSGVTTRYAVGSQTDTVASSKVIYREIELAAAASVSAWVWQNSGTDKDITDEWLRATYITLQWKRPL